jgi:hypothetical protein
MSGPSRATAHEVAERFRLLVASVKDYAIIILDPTGKITTWNAGAERITGYTEGEVIGKHCSIFYTAEDLDSGKADRELATALREGGYEEEGWRVRKDGARHWANVTVTPLYADDGELVGFAKITQDLTARRAAEQEGQRFRLLVESVKDYAIFVLDVDGHVLTWNAGAVRLKGYSSDEIIGRHFSTFYAPEDVAAGKCDRELEAAARDGRFEDEGFRYCKDGSKIWANVVITALRDPDGTLVGFAKVTRDLTERVRLESARAHAFAAEEAARRKDEFLAIVGHELRNPLGSIVTAAHLLRLRGPRPTEKEVAIIERQATHMTRLVDDLLDASRALRDKVALFPKKVEIGVVLANAIELAGPMIEHRRHSLTVDVPDGGLVVDIDVDRTGQVFGNLLTNAAKYTPEGGRIHVSAEGRDDEVVVRVEDNGEGIAPELLAHVFELFVQGEQGLDRSVGGLGIGLAVAKKFVEAQRGRIVAESAGVGRGSRFAVHLPRVRTSVSEEVATPAPNAPTTPRRRILLVDDSEESIDLMRVLLEHLGQHVRVAYDGESAVAEFRRSLPDIVFLDIGLPGLSGYEVAALMRATPGSEKIPIIALSGYAREVDRARAVEAGFSSHLAKPVRIERVEEFVRALGG